MSAATVAGIPASWEIPRSNVAMFAPRRTRYCVCIPVLNEGSRLTGQLERMARMRIPADLIIADAGSTDDSTAPTLLRSSNVRALLVQTDPGGLSTQMRMFFAFAIEQGYEGIVTLHGNGKDGVESIPLFLRALNEGWDYVQGSRFIPGGLDLNTPLDRKIGLKLVHAPLVSLASGFRYTDTTNGFRAYSTRFITDEAVQPFRSVFEGYELPYYLAIKAPRLGYRVKELPVTRSYPRSGPEPVESVSRTAIFRALLRAVAGRYAPDA